MSDRVTDPLDPVEVEEKVLKHRALGKSLGDIALELEISTARVREVITEVANRVRETHYDVAAEAFAMQVEVLRRWLGIVHKHIEAIGAGSSPFDDRPFRVAVSICERQAKLLGLDKRAEGGEEKNSWISNAPLEQVLTYAREMKYNLPTKFDLSGGKA